MTKLKRGGQSARQRRQKIFFEQSKIRILNSGGNWNSAGPSLPALAKRRNRRQKAREEIFSPS